MKKLFLGATLGVVAGAVGYKMYKENEDKIKDFLAEHLDEEMDVDEIDIEDLEELRDCIDEMIDAKLEAEDAEYEYDDYDDYYDEEFVDSDEDLDYILLNEQKDEEDTENK